MFCGNSDGVQAGVLCLGMKTKASSGYLGLHSHPSTGSGTPTDRRTEVQNAMPTMSQLADQGDLPKEICYFTSKGLIWKGRVEVDWAAGGIIPHRGSLKEVTCSN